MPIIGRHEMRRVPERMRGGQLQTRHETRHKQLQTRPQHVTLPRPRMRPGHEHIERIKPRATGHERRGMNEQLSALRNVQQQVPKMNKRGSSAKRNVQQQVRGLNKRGSAELLKGKECDWHSVSIPCPEMVSSQAACIATGMCVPVRP